MKKIFSFALAYVYVLSLLISPVYARDMRTPQVAIDAKILETLPDRDISDILDTIPTTVPNTPPASNGSSFGQSEGLGEGLGMGGVIVICIKVTSGCIFGIYDSAGSYVGSVNQAQALSDPGRTAGLLGIAEARSQANLASNPPSWDNIVPRIGLTYDVTGDGKTLIKPDFHRDVMGGGMTQGGGYASQATNASAVSQAKQAVSSSDVSLSGGDALSGNPYTGLPEEIQGGGMTVVEPPALGDTTGGDPSDWSDSGSSALYPGYKEPIIDYSSYSKEELTNGISLESVYDTFKAQYTPETVSDGGKKKKKKKKKEEDTQVSQPVDSVNWDNVNLYYKAPKTSRLNNNFEGIKEVKAKGFLQRLRTLNPFSISNAHAEGTNEFGQTFTADDFGVRKAAPGEVDGPGRDVLRSGGGDPSDWSDPGSGLRQATDEEFQELQDLTKKSQDLENQIDQIEKTIQGLPETTDVDARGFLRDNWTAAKEELERVNSEISRLQMIPGMPQPAPPLSTGSLGSSGGAGGLDPDLVNSNPQGEARKRFEDEVMRGLAEEYGDSLGALGDGVDSLEGRVQQLENDQFRTTRPGGGSDFSLGDGFGRMGDGFRLTPRLDFDTSFAGDDDLRTRLDGQPLNPSSAMILQSGLTPSMINGIANGLNDSLTARRPKCGIYCFVLLIGRPGVYKIEIIVIFEDFDRQKKSDLKPNKDVDPNDPLYLHVVEKKKKFLGFLGSNVKVGFSAGAGSGGITGGAGVSMGSSKGKTPEVFDQWGLHAIGYTPKEDPNSAWNLVDASKKNVLIAVIDSGLDMTHEDKPKFLWKNEGEIPNNNKDDDNNGYVDDVNGWNFVDENNDLTDYTGHGTFVAGIIAANTNNGKGIAGINPGAVIMPIKIAGKEPISNSFAVYRAIQYAVNNGARIINVSYGGKGKSDLIQLAINYAHRRGVFVSIASGNTGEYIPDVIPAANKRAFTVGAIDISGQCSTMSSTGPNNALLAPGEQIYSMRPIDSFNKRAFGKNSLARFYYKMDGTSFSAPMVAATASLMLVANPRLTNIEIEDILMATAVDMDEEGWDWKTGAGLLNAAAAIKGAKGDYLVYKITEARINKDKKKKIESVDIFASVRGKSLDSFIVEIGKGKRAKKFKKISGPFKMQAYNDWVARIDKKNLKGSKEWIVRISVKDKSGNTKTAKMLLELK